MRSSGLLEGEPDSMCPILTTRRDGCAKALIEKAGTAPIRPSTSRRLIGRSQRFAAQAPSFDHLVGRARNLPLEARTMLGFQAPWPKSPRSDYLNPSHSAAA